eukprot:11954528-Heterocapsa_arctica.AAC.1
MVYHHGCPSALAESLDLLLPLPSPLLSPGAVMVSRLLLVNCSRARSNRSRSTTSTAALWRYSKLRIGDPTIAL